MLKRQCLQRLKTMYACVQTRGGRQSEVLGLGFLPVQ